MSQYLLSTYQIDGEVPAAPTSPQEMQQFMQRVMALEEEMDQAGAFVFGGGLTGPADATVITKPESDIVVTDGPFAETKEYIAGFYIINAASDEAAIEWAHKVVEAINHPIEVRPFHATGKVADNMPPG